MPRKPAYRPGLPSWYSEPRERRDVTRTLDGLPPLRPEQWPDVLAAKREALPVLAASLRGWVELAEDVEGLADVTAVRAVLTYRDGGLPPAAWARRQARQTAWLAVERLRRSKPERNGYDDHQSDCAEPDPAVAEVEALDLLDRLVRELDARESEVVRGVAAGRTYRQIGAGLGISETHAHRLYSRVKPALDAAAARLGLAG